MKRNKLKTNVALGLKVAVNNKKDQRYKKNLTEKGQQVNNDRSPLNTKLHGLPKDLGAGQRHRTVFTNICRKLEKTQRRLIARSLAQERRETSDLTVVRFRS